MMKALIPAALMILSIAIQNIAGPIHGFDHSHALFSKVLRTHVKHGLVDYSALKSNPDDLDAYLGLVGNVSKNDFDRWTQNEQIAFLLNAYNAHTLRLIIMNYPVASIKKIGGWFSGPWDQEIVHLFGKTITLATVEHKMLRTDYNEPRIHFAMVCAALGCPSLRDEAYRGDNLEEQLWDQGRRFLSATNKNRVDAKRRVIHLSPIFDWFEKDFEKKAGSVIEFIRPFLPDTKAEALKKGGFSIQYTEYDWSLNDQ